MTEAVWIATIAALSGIATAVITAYFGYKSDQRRLAFERERLEIEIGKPEVKQPKQKTKNKKTETENKEDASQKDTTKNVRPRVNQGSRFLRAFWKTPVLLAFVLGGTISYPLFLFVFRSIACQPPVVVMTVSYENGEAKAISPGGTFDTALAPSAIFRAKTLNAAAITCEWEYTGNAIVSLGPHNSCDVRITFSQQLGEIGIVILSAIDSQCSQRNVFSFIVETK